MTFIQNSRVAFRTRPDLLLAILVCLFLANIFDPLGTLGLKYLAFVIAAVSSIWSLKYLELGGNELAIGGILFVIWPVWSLAYGAVRGGDLSVGLTQVTPFLFIWVLAAILPALDVQRPLRAFYACMFTLAAVVVAAFALIFFFPDSAVSQTVYNYLSGLEGKEGWFGTQSFDGIEVPWIYFSSTLCLVPTFVYFLNVGKVWRAGVVLLALGLTFSKAGLTIALAFGVVYGVRALFTRFPMGFRNGTGARLRRDFQRFLPATVVGGVALLVFLSLPTFSDQIEDAWTGNSDTAAVRIGHFHSVMNLFVQHPAILIVGQGAGVPFYSLGESGYVQSFEIDYLNAVRKFGLPWFIAYSAIVYYSARRLIKTRHVECRAFGLALISAYLAAGTNPELLSSLFLTLMTLTYFAQRERVATSSRQGNSFTSTDQLKTYAVRSIGLI